MGTVFHDDRETLMHPELHAFVRQVLGVVCITLAPVLLTAFLSIPLILEGVPGGVRASDAVKYLHVT